MKAQILHILKQPDLMKTLIIRTAREKFTTMIQLPAKRSLLQHRGLQYDMKFGQGHQSKPYHKYKKNVLSFIASSMYVCVSLLKKKTKQNIFISCHVNGGIYTATITDHILKELVVSLR